jgi:hypothetical protein
MVAENDDKTKKMVYQCRLRPAARLKLDGPSLGRSPGAHKQRRPVNQDQIQIFRGNRVDTIFGAGLAALLFFLWRFSLAVLVSLRANGSRERAPDDRLWINRGLGAPPLALTCGHSSDLCRHWKRFAQASPLKDQSLKLAFVVPSFAR